MFKSRACDIFRGKRDPLTNAFSYEFFNKRLKELDDSGALPLSAVICDVNGLSLIKDTLGAGEAEALTVGAARIIARCVRRDDLIARSGERFFILLPFAGEREVCHIAGRIQAACNDAREESGGSFCISASAGCATKRNRDEDIYGILRSAEQALFVQKQREQKSFYESLLKSIKKALYEKSHETDEHGERLVNLSRSLGEALGLPEEQLERLEVLATLHDIGKVCVDSAILMKSEPLAEDDWAEIKKHPEAGCRIAMAVPQLKDIAVDILSHHERWDGAGYPRGICKESIPLLARIISVVDAFDAMTSKRCYREPVAVEEALAEIEVSAGAQFDPQIAEIFVKMKRNDKL